MQRALIIELSVQTFSGSRWDFDCIVDSELNAIDTVVNKSIIFSPSTFVDLYDVEVQSTILRQNVFIRLACNQKEENNMELNLFLFGSLKHNLSIEKEMNHHHSSYGKSRDRRWLEKQPTRNAGKNKLHICVSRLR